MLALQQPNEADSIITGHGCVWVQALGRRAGLVRLISSIEEQCFSRFRLAAKLQLALETLLFAPMRHATAPFREHAMVILDLSPTL
jgi:hypothetical protein